MSNMENGFNDDLLEGLASQPQETVEQEPAMDLELSGSLGKLANRSNAFKQRLEDFDAIKIGLAVAYGKQRFGYCSSQHVLVY